MKETKVTIHQPEHFPYMGFFQKISASDIFIILDNVKFNKNGFQHRNRILTLEEKEEWITVQVGKSAWNQNINEIKVNWTAKWKRRLLEKIKRNLNFDADEFYSHEKLIDINMASIKWACDKMDIRVPLVFSSELQVSGSKSVLLANLVRSVGGTKYISGQGGKNYLDPSVFSDIEIEYFRPQVEDYYSCLCYLTEYSKRINKDK